MRISLFLSPQDPTTRHPLRISSTGKSDTSKYNDPATYTTPSDLTMVFLQNQFRCPPMVGVKRT